MFAPRLLDVEDPWGRHIPLVPAVGSPHPGVLLVRTGTPTAPEHFLDPMRVVPALGQVEEVLRRLPPQLSERRRDVSWTRRATRAGQQVGGIRARLVSMDGEHPAPPPPNPLEAAR